MGSGLDPWRPPAHPTHHRPKRRGRRALFWFAVVVSALALTGGLLVAAVGLYGEAQPERPVRAYFKAIADGDASTALSLGDVPPGNRAFLTAAVLTEQRKIGKIQDLELGAVNRQDDKATVEVSYRLVSESRQAVVQDVVPLVRDGYRWKLQRAAQPVIPTFSAGKNRVTIAGAAIPTEQALFFPGALPVLVDSTLLETNLDSAVVKFDAEASVDVELEVAATGRKAIGTAIEAALIKCATDNDQPNCPTKLTTLGYVPNSMRGTTTPPSVTLTVLPGDAGLLRAVGTFGIDATWRELDFNNQAKTKTGSLTLSYDATLAPLEPVVVSWNPS